MNWKVDKLKKENSLVTKEYGNSMTPLLKSGQEHKLSSVEWTDVEKGDIVFCKVNGRYYTHLVKSINIKKGCLIGNNKGGTNGWTKNIYGKVIEKY